MFENIMERQIEHDVILINRMNEQTCILNGSGMKIWHMLKKFGSFSRLQQTTAIPEYMKDDYEQFVSGLKGFIDGNSSKVGPSLHQYFLKKDVPLAVGLEIGLSCQLNCRHCYNPEPRSKERLSTDDVKKVSEDMKRMGTPFVIVTGGEPLAHPEFNKICEILAANGFAYKIFTNGYGMTKEIAKRLKELNCFLVAFTLFGADDKTHEYITRTKDSFKRICNAIRFVKDSEINVAVTFFLMKHNFKIREKMRRFAEEELGVVPSFTFSVTPKESGSLAPVSLRIRQKQLETFITENGIEESLSEDCGRSDSPLCTAGRTIAAINTKGEVLPCLSLPIPAGNIHNESFSDIWRKSTVFQSFKRRKIEELKECVNCKMKDICLRCYTGAMLEGGDLLGRAPHSCEVTSILYKKNKKGGVDK